MGESIQFDFYCARLEILKNSSNFAEIIHL